MATYNARFTIGSLSSINDASATDIINTLHAYGPYVLVDDDGSYLAYSDPEFVTEGYHDIDTRACSIYEKALHDAWEKGLDQEAAVAETITILRTFGFADDEIAEFFVSEPEYFDVNPLLLNGRLEHCTYQRHYFDMPEF